MKRQYVSLAGLSGDFGQLYLSPNTSLVISSEGGKSRKLFVGEVFPVSHAIIADETVFFAIGEEIFQAKTEDFDVCQFKYDDEWHFTPKCVVNEKKRHSNDTTWAIEVDDMFSDFLSICEKYGESRNSRRLIDNYRDARAALREEVLISAYSRQHEERKTREYVNPKIERMISEALEIRGPLTPDQRAIRQWIEMRNAEIQNGPKMLKAFLDRGGKFRVTWDGDVATVTPYYPKAEFVTENGHIWVIFNGRKTLFR